MILMNSWETILGCVDEYIEKFPWIYGSYKQNFNHRSYQWRYRRNDLDVPRRLDWFFGSKYLHGRDGFDVGSFVLLQY